MSATVKHGKLRGRGQTGLQMMILICCSACSSAGVHEPHPCRAARCPRGGESGVHKHDMWCSRPAHDPWQAPRCLLTVAPD